MRLIVQKYGGTSVGDINRINQVARKIIETYNKGDKVVVVVSAMAGETNRLINLAHEISPAPDERAYDVLVSTGEQVSVALLCMAIQDGGCKTVSLLGHQVKILTDSSFRKARIIKVDGKRILTELEGGNIVVVAGFQGVDENNNITTLGRGGSDTTAVALAVALKADLCEIYTDVEGVFTTNPAIYDKARKLDIVSYDEMLEMASLGAKVLQTRSVELAKKYNVPLWVRSTFSDDKGTLVTKEGPRMEKVLVSSITCDKNEAKITVVRVPDKPGIAYKIFTPISEANIVVDMIVQNVSSDVFTDLTFTVSKADFSEALRLVNKHTKEIGARGVEASQDIAKVSIVGVGMKSHAGIASKMFSILAGEGINILMISTSEIKISCVIDAKYAELAVRVLHDAFELGDK